MFATFELATLEWATLEWATLKPATIELGPIALINTLLVSPWFVSFAFAIAAFIFASFVEYWIHRLMHASQRVGKKHRDHHKRNVGQGVVKEFRDYVLGSSLAMGVMFLVSIPAGLGWLFGALAFAAFSAYAHQLQHENPTKCFWMKMPVHYVHHKYGMWHHNFGLAVDWWDYVFGTYKAVDWLTEEELRLADRGYFELQWW